MTWTSTEYMIQRALACISCSLSIPNDIYIYWCDKYGTYHLVIVSEEFKVE
jgi:hypothetical protein